MPFDPQERAALDSFLSGISSLIRSAANYRTEHSNLDCNRFSNHVSIQLAALIAIARLRGNRRDLESAALGIGGGVDTPWTKQVVETIYGTKAKLLNCYHNDKPTDYYQISSVQPGELVDRYRAHEAQTIGYPMFSLTHLLLSAKIMSEAGYQPYGAIGGRLNPMQLALEYYSKYFSVLLSPDEVTVPADFDVPGHEQYTGKLICTKNGNTIEGRDGMIVPFLLGGECFKNNRAIDAVLQKAMSFAPKYYAFSDTETLYYGALCSLAGR
jgi:hypothetical protein